MPLGSRCPTVSARCPAPFRKGLPYRRLGRDALRALRLLARPGLRHRVQRDRRAERDMSRLQRLSGGVDHRQPRLTSKVNPGFRRAFGAIRDGTIAMRGTGPSGNRLRLGFEPIKPPVRHRVDLGAQRLSVRRPRMRAIGVSSATLPSWIHATSISSTWSNGTLTLCVNRPSATIPSRPHRARSSLKAPTPKSVERCALELCRIGREDDSEPSIRPRTSDRGPDLGAHGVDLGDRDL
jgi:hypothetical protein